MLFTTEEVQTKALNEVTMQVEQGEFVAIMGPSGCGKSTLLNILGTLDSPTSGSYFFEGKQVDKMSENQLTALRKGNLGFIFQSFNLIDELTVYDKARSAERESETGARESKPVASCQSFSAAAFRRTAATCCHSSRRGDGLQVVACR